MVSDIGTRLKRLGIEPDSEVGNYFIKLDSLYAQLESIDTALYNLQQQRKQVKEDIELQEMMIKYESNKAARQKVMKEGGENECMDKRRDCEEC